MKAGYGEQAFPQPTTKRKVDSSAGDFYPTPLWATEMLLAEEEFPGLTWEPACGDGQMSKVLEINGLTVSSSDLFDRGYGNTGVDFLKDNEIIGGDCDNIITNPPYHLAEEFLHRALEIATKKVAFLLRLAFLETQDRYDTIYSKCPPSRVWIFSKRVTFYPKGVKQRGSGTTAYAWMIWDKAHEGKCELLWLPPKRPVLETLTLENLGLS